MATYKIHWTEESWYTAYVEADSEAEAQKKFDDGLCFYSAITTGTEIQDTVIVEEDSDV
jgi:hypothetical protein